MADLTLIESNIVSTLQNVPLLKKVYDHEPMNIEVLPAATLFFDGFGQDDQATRSKSARWNWIIRIYVSLQDAKKAQEDIKALLLESLKQLRQNPHLGGSCLYHAVATGEVFVNMSQNNPQLMAELRLEAMTNEPY